ncbi:MAG TPA: hypothetical protein VEB22_11245 [Phycisphaerales bacterium]|nr:hypothetical protein [Phycisphaerales bacterium]
MTTGQILAIGGIGLAGLYLLRRSAPPPVAPTTTRPTTLNAGTQLQRVVGSLTSTPLEAVGNFAQRSPTWLKVAAFPVGATSVAADLIEDPKGTISDAYNATKNFFGGLF